jgi:hypothetical protein
MGIYIERAQLTQVTFRHRSSELDLAVDIDGC